MISASIMSWHTWSSVCRWNFYFCFYWIVWMITFRLAFSHKLFRIQWVVHDVHVTAAPASPVCRHTGFDEHITFMFTYSFNWGHIGLGKLNPLDVLVWPSQSVSACCLLRVRSSESRPGFSHWLFSVFSSFSGSFVAWSLAVRHTSLSL